MAQFGRSRSLAQRKYRQFVREGRESRPWEDLTGQIYLGSEKFIAKHPAGDQKIKEIPRVMRRPTRPRLDQLFARNKSTAILQAYREYGYRLHEIAEYLGVHYATVSRRLRKMEQQS